MSRYCPAIYVIMLGVCACSKAPSINGKVVDGFGNPVEGVSVKVAGTQYTSQTDRQGKYAVAYVPGDLTVGISKPGYTESSFSAKIATETTYPAEDKTLYRIPDEPGVWYMDFDTKQYVKLKASIVKPDETVEWGPSMSRRWHQSYPVRITPDNSTTIRVANGSPIRFVDNDGVKKRLIQLVLLANGSMSLVNKSWTDRGGAETNEVHLLGEAESPIANGLLLRTTNLPAGGVYAFANYSSWGGGEIDGPVYLFTVETSGPPMPSPASGAATGRYKTNAEKDQFVEIKKAVAEEEIEGAPVAPVSGDRSLARAFYGTWKSAKPGKYQFVEVYWSSVNIVKTIFPESLPKDPRIDYEDYSKFPENGHYFEYVDGRLECAYPVKEMTLTMTDRNTLVIHWLGPAGGLVGSGKQRAVEDVVYSRIR